MITYTVKTNNLLSHQLPDNRKNQFLVSIGDVQTSHIDQRELHELACLYIKLSIQKTKLTKYNRIVEITYIKSV